jgi:hypothetical protein
MTEETAIGDLLVRSGIIDATGLARGHEIQEKSGILLRLALTTWGLPDEQSLVAAIVQGRRFDALGPGLPEIPAAVAGLLPSDFCRQRTVGRLQPPGEKVIFENNSRVLHAKELGMVQERIVAIWGT